MTLYGPAFVFDVESIGPHGEGFAVGWVVVESTPSRPGRWVERESGLAWCDPGQAVGNAAGRAWVREHVRLEGNPVHGSPTHESPREVREEFWLALRNWATAHVWAYAGWPVEARFLAQAIADSAVFREWQGPYPLHEVATLRVAAGLPLMLPRVGGDVRENNPLAHARLSSELMASAIDDLRRQRARGIR